MARVLVFVIIVIMNAKKIVEKMPLKKKREANKLAKRIVKDYGLVIKKLANT